MLRSTAVRSQERIVETTRFCPKPGDDRCLALQSRLEQGHRLWHQGAHEEGTRVLEEVLRECPDCPRGRMDVIDHLVASKRWPEAQARLEMLSVDGLDRHPRAHYLRGVLLRETGRTAEAVDPLTTFAEALPRDHEAQLILADLLWRLERYDDALARARRAIRLQPDYLDGYRLALDILDLRLRRRRATLRLLGRARDVQTDDPAFYVTLGNVYYDLDHADDARELCDRALRLNDALPEGLCLSARLDARAENYESCRDKLIRLRDIDPGHGPFCAANLARVHARGLREWRQAIELLIEARQTYPDDAYVREITDEVIGAIVEGLRRAEAGKKWKARFQEIRHRHESAARILAEMLPSEHGLPITLALSEREGQRVEFMQCFPGQARDLAKEIAAFSTSNDGNIFLGVRDDGTVCGVPALQSPQDRDRLRDRIAGVSGNGVNPPAQVEVYFVPSQDHTVVKIFVPKGPDPVYYVDGRPYLRHLDQSRPAKPGEVARLMAQHFGGQAP
jgi:tetratricopeptide (TPR) repeat protein